MSLVNIAVASCFYRIGSLLHKTAICLSVYNNSTGTGLECRQYSVKHYLIHTLGAPAHKAHNQFLRKKGFKVRLMVRKKQ